MSPPNVLTKIQRFGIADGAELRSDSLGRQARLYGPACYHTIKESCDVLAIGRGKGESQLEPSPYGAIEQFGMIARGDDNHITRHLVELHQQKRDDALDFPGLVCVTALFTYGVKLVEEQDARLRPNIIEQFTKPSVCLAEVTADQRVVAHDEKWECKGFRDSLSVGRFPVARRSRKQDTVARLEAVGPEHVGADMLLDELARVLPDRQRKQKTIKLGTRFDLDDRLSPRSAPWRHGGSQRRRGDGNGRERTLESVSENMVLLCALVGGQGLGCRPQSLPIAGRGRAYKGNEEVTSCHHNPANVGSAAPADAAES